jgi:integrase
MSGNSIGVYADTLAKGLEKGGFVRTAKAYLTAAARFTKFNGGHDIKLERITAAMISDFQQTLKTEGKSMNTISFYMRTLRAIYNKAVEEKRIQRRGENLFSSVYTGVAPSRKMALTSAELARFTELDATNNLSERLKLTLAAFLFCYHARGMCFTDIAHLKKSNITDNTIHYRRKKTNQVLEVKIVPAMRRILDRYAAETAGSEYLFPIMTKKGKDLRLQYESGLRVQNKRLKKIAAMLNINKGLSTNCARHSWATVAKNEGLPLAVISEGLGHTSQKTTEIYLASLEQAHLDHASILVSEAISSGRHTKHGRKRNRSPDTVYFGFRYGGFR